jgi:hypothetical protein
VAAAPSRARNAARDPGVVVVVIVVVGGPTTVADSVRGEYACS